jgi:SAM-dependent methyltransferase
MTHPTPHDTPAASDPPTPRDTPVASDAPSDAPVAGDAATHWEGFYRESTPRWSGRPNPVLVDVVGTRPPGRALDLGCGEGGDVLWLAERGFTVTGVDISATVVDRARAHAAEAGLAHRVTIERHDLAATFPTGEFDLVSAQYLHSPAELPRADILRRAAAAVAPGGTLLIVGHAALPPWAPDPTANITFPSPQDVLADLALPPQLWRTERAETTARQATGPDGRTGTLTDSVVVLTRSMSDQ